MGSAECGYSAEKLRNEEEMFMKAKILGLIILEAVAQPGTGF
jgi:hypothetical protein